MDFQFCAAGGIPKLMLQGPSVEFMLALSADYRNKPSRFSVEPVMYRLADGQLWPIRVLQLGGWGRPQDCVCDLVDALITATRGIWNSTQVSISCIM